MGAPAIRIESETEKDLQLLEIEKKLAEINLLKAQTKKVDLERQVLLFNQFSTLLREEKWSYPRIARAFPEMANFFP
jgi:hypothetical protein